MVGHCCSNPILVGAQIAPSLILLGHLSLNQVTVITDGRNAKDLVLMGSRSASGVGLVAFRG
jgi:hypothetical protein